MSKNKSMWNKGVGLLLDTHENSNLAILLNEISLLALNRFKWTNLPQGLESRHIEKALFEHGQCAFFEHENGGVCCLPCSPSNGVNVYGDPLGYTVHGIGYSNILNADKVVRILNNDRATPTSPIVLKYANLINEVEITQSRNLKQLDLWELLYRYLIFLLHFQHLKGLNILHHKLYILKDHRKH